MGFSKVVYVGTFVYIVYILFDMWQIGILHLLIQDLTVWHFVFPIVWCSYKLYQFFG
jgi:hypothetical protein